METKKIEGVRDRIDLEELDNLPETIEDIESQPILKPLIEFHKQATMLIKEDKIEANFLKDIKEDIKFDLDKGIYDNSYIVKKYKNLEREYERLILIYGRYTDLADEKIIELKKIVEKYYITKKEYKKALDMKKTDEKENIPKEKKKELKETTDEEEFQDYLKRKQK
jgi:hypothetical protein